MADYQSLLTRAVANLPNAGAAAARQSIYERARTALVTQLRSMRPPLPDSDIEREERALDKAIAQVESQYAPTDSPLKAPAEAGSAPLPPSAPDRPPAPKPTEPEASWRAEFGRARGRAVPTGGGQIFPAGADRSRRADSDAASPQPAACADSGASISVRSAFRQTCRRAGRQTGAAAGVRRSRRPSLRARRGQAAPRAGGAPAGRSREPSRPAGDRVEGGQRERSSGKSGQGRPKRAGRSSWEFPGAPPVAASLADDAEPAAVTPVATVDVERSEGQRPFAPTSVAEMSRSWPWLALAAVLGVVLSIAGAAILMRQKPQDLAIAPPPESQQEAKQAPAKIAQRAQPSPAEGRAPEPASPVPAAGEPQPGQAAQSGQAAPPQDGQSPAPLPQAGRAAMLIASPDNPQKPVVNMGSTVWSTIPASPGQPASLALKADADIPDLKMHATMILRKNTDPTLEATHTIDLKFAFADGAPITGFKDVGLPQMRKLDAPASEQLNSVKVKISDVYFLVALAKGDQDVARNVDLMKTRAWFDFPLLLNDDRIAKLVFQKSADGEAMLEKALDAWK